MCTPIISVRQSSGIFLNKQRKEVDHVAASIIGCFGAPAPSPSDVNEMLASIGEMHRDLGCLEVSPLVASCATTFVASLRVDSGSVENCMCVIHPCETSFAGILLVLVSLSKLVY
jgi:hypothetical protein